MKATFEKLYENYHQDVYQYIYYMVKNKQDTEDILQDVYLKALRSYDTFKRKSSEKTWLFSIAKHVTFDHFRKLKRTRNRFFEYFDWGKQGESIQTNQPLPEEIAVLDDQMQQVYKCLDQCSFHQKQVIILRYLQSFTIKETADILNWSISKVKTTQHRAIASLQQCVRKEDD
ncbi:RNA polymerase sigma factor SigX [Gracilibacillus halophilus YIM-C55.5]|uniref:RNA polymerase sigma factor n=1 Tax=Gracilibacillus halophilus YIM-C55.5 TaxID=1308866 RepID=N4WSL0_9BACI|nr:sigma-70 family RNA polymerase sigma factor [Gracilibacillus halophilus]ENH97370.1 RNA polymerase sigma factor SigX [Gracilibacillus halophilus YIM-C55.5]